MWLQCLTIISLHENIDEKWTYVSIMGDIQQWLMTKLFL
jgi:hypothetical protein